MKDLDHYNSLINVLSETDEISQKLNKCYKKMSENIITTPTSILDSFQRFTEPKEELDYAIELFDNLVELTDNIEDAKINLDEFNESKEKDISELLGIIRMYGKLDRNIKFLSKYKNIKRIETYMNRGKNIKTTIYSVIEKAFFRKIKESPLKKLLNLHKISEFLVVNGDQSSIAEKYLHIYAQKFSFDKNLENQDDFIYEIGNSKKLFNEIKSMNSFLFERKLADFLNKNMINYMIEDMKTNILRFLNVLDKNKNPNCIFPLLQIYSISKSHNLDISEYVYAFMQRFFTFIDEITTMNHEMKVEEFVLFTNKISKNLNDDFVNDYVLKCGKKMHVSNRSELIDKLLLTSYTKLKHLCINEDELKQKVYLLVNVYELSRTKQNIGEKSLFDEVKEYKKNIIEKYKERSLKLKSDSTRFIDQSVVQIKSWNLSNELKSGLTENLKKILKETAKKKGYKKDINKELSKLDEINK